VSLCLQRHRFARWSFGNEVTAINAGIGEMGAKQGLFLWAKSRNLSVPPASNQQDIKRDLANAAKTSIQPARYWYLIENNRMTIARGRVFITGL
jgi:hypothetical protein